MPDANTIQSERGLRPVGEVVFSAISAAGLLTVRDRLAVAAKGLVGRPFVTYGRGRPDQYGGFDNIGFVREAVAQATGCRTLDDLAVYNPAWDADNGVKVEHAAELLTNWGFRELAEGEAWEPGDVMVTAMPNASMAVVTHTPRRCDDEFLIAHAYHGRASVESYVGPWWFKRLAKVFRYVGAEG